MRISNQTTDTKNRIQESGYKKAGCGMRDIREKRSGNAGSGIRIPFEILFVKLKVILLCDLL